MAIKKILFLLADIFLIFLSVFFAFFVRFEGFIPERYFLNILGITFFAIILTVSLFYFFGLYSFSWEYVSIEDLISLAKATILSFLILTSIYFVFKDYFIFSGFPRSTLFITYFFIFLFCGGVRFAKRIYLTSFFQKEKKEKKEKVLIVGTENLAEQTARAILGSPSYLLVGFVDEDAKKKGMKIHNIKVLGTIDDIAKIVQDIEIDQIIIATPPYLIKKVIENSRKAGIKKIKIVPSLVEILRGQISLKDIRDIEIEDLLGREPIKLDTEAIEQFIKNKKVLITGACGSIGKELSFQIARFDPQYLILLDQDETGIFNLEREMKERFPFCKASFFVCNIQDQRKIENIFKEFLPQVVFHSAAYKHVPLMEKHPDEAVKNNIFGTKILAENALKFGVEKFIFISTDKAVNPTSVMGATKRVGEMICQILNEKNKTRFISVRFGNVLDSRGNVISIFKEQIKKGGPIEITHPEMKRYFMINSEACLLVMEAGAIGKGGEIFVLDMGRPIKIVDLAKEMIKLSGYEPDKEIPIVFTRPRPGEKFFEEISTEKEEFIKTPFSEIFIAKPEKIKSEELEKHLQELKKAVDDCNNQKIINILKKIVPNYQK